MYICIYIHPDNLEILNDFVHWGDPEDYENAAQALKGNWTTFRENSEQIEVHMSYDQYVMLNDNE
jgi:hypothetical protein